MFLIMCVFFVWLGGYSTQTDTSPTNPLITPSVRPWSFMVSLLVDGSHTCSGALVNGSFILTAARCVYFLSSWEVTNLRVAVGISDLDNMGVATLFKVEKIIIHPGFNRKTSANDLALLVLMPNIFSTKKNPMEKIKNSTVNSIALPNFCDYNDYVGKSAHIIGWKFLTNVSGESNTTSLKQQLTIDIIANLECLNYFGLSDQRTTKDTFICGYKLAKPLSQKMTLDNTMNGAAVVFRADANSNWTLIGVVSGGKPGWCSWWSAWLYPAQCYRSAHPYGMYITRVASAVKWITNQCIKSSA